MYTEETQVLENKNAGLNYYALTLAAPYISAAARPGQFVMVAPSAGLQPFLKRPMGINVISAEKGQIRLIYRMVGHGTRLMSALEPGQTIQMLGPLGNGWRSIGEGRALLVGGGTGIAPLLPLAEDLSGAGLACDILLGANSARELVCAEEFTQLGHCASATLDGSWGVHGPVTLLLPQAPPAYDMVYCCGPQALMSKVAEWAARYDLPCQVSLEERMGCGFGVCMGCVCPVADAGGAGGYAYKRVCCDGPVFDSREVKW